MPQGSKVFFVESYATGRVAKEWAYCYSHKAKESSTVILWDAGSAMNVEALLKLNGYREVDRDEYRVEVFRVATETAETMQPTGLPGTRFCGASVLSEAPEANDKGI